MWRIPKVGLAPWPTVARLSILLAAGGIALVSWTTLGHAGGGPSFTHWWCSPGTLRSVVHGGGRGRPGSILLTALEVHWPHLLPLLSGVATLAYLRRANARYASRTAQPDPGDPHAGASRPVTLARAATSVHVEFELTRRDRSVASGFGRGRRPWRSQPLESSEA
jgi:hypothetical protein